MQTGCGADVENRENRKMTKMPKYKFKENVALRDWSNYKIGGPAKFFFAPKNEKEIRWAVGEAKAKKLPVFILGGGTNLLIDDAGFKGLVIKPEITIMKPKGLELTVGSGVLMADLLKFCAKRSLSGLEWAGGLPGTVGGAIRGNAGCFGGEMKDVVASVKSFDTKAMKIIERKAEQCMFGYRSSIFKKNGGREIILEAVLRLSKGNKKEISDAITEKIEHRKRNHPLDYPNIGSIFKNVPLITIYKKTSTHYKSAIKRARISFRNSEFSVKKDPFPVISAAKLISETGLRGVSLGGAMISGKHPNFIVNVLDARSLDVKELIRLAKAQVRKKFRITLEEEVQIV